MKRLLVFLTVIAFGFSGTLFAQNSEGKADDAARISITPQVTAQEIPQGAKNMLMNKMKQICTKNGLAGDGNNPFFIMDATVDILSKELTPTAPPMHALYLSVNFFIKDAKSGAIYSESSIEIKGVGKNETKAYSQALKNINTSKGQFKAMVEKGKVKIIEFYNSECDFIISKATALHKQGNNGEAIKVLESVPSVSKECYAKCMELLSEIEPPVEEPVAIVTPVATVTPDSSGSTQKSNGGTAAGTSVAATSAGLGTMVDFSKMGGYPGAKSTYKKEFKYTPFELPIDQFGNFTFSEKSVIVSGKVVRYQFETSGDNNPDYLLKLAQPVYQALGYEIVFAKTNKELGGSRTIHYHYGNGKLGGKYRIPWGSESGSYLLVKSTQGGKTVYVAIFFVVFNDKTVINQDYVEVE